MSLKYMHVFFIVLAILVSLGFGVWAVRLFFITKDLPIFLWGTGSLIASQVLIPYLVWFWKKLKKEGIS